ncbi:hypothetical protein AcW1_007795 [Taiwanofungus camphoratus]|nr:hypothetical protein AcW1_007795 [Antrodia cinnamomea]
MELFAELENNKVPHHRTPLSVLPPSALFARSLRVAQAPDHCTRPCEDRPCAVIVHPSARLGDDATIVDTLVVDQLLRDCLGINFKVEQLVNSMPPLPSPPDTLSPSIASDTCPSPIPIPLPIPHQHHPGPAMSNTKKRRSLQSIFSLPHSPLADSPASRARSSSAAVPTHHPARDSASSDYGTISSLPDLPLLDLPSPSRDSPPPDLLDDDPFANLSPAPSLRRLRPAPLVLAPLNTSSSPGEPLPQLLPPPPRSPLAQSASCDTSPTRCLFAPLAFASFQSPPATPPSSPVFPPAHRPRLVRPKSSGHQVRPAYTRPAFAPRPSLPSLNTLAQAHVAVPKVRRGRVGAQLPAEPWAHAAPHSPRSFSGSPGTRRRGHLRRPTELSTIRDSRMILDGQMFSFGEREDAVDANADADLADSPGSSSSRDTIRPHPHQPTHAADVVDAADDAMSMPPLMRGYSDPWPRRREPDSPPSTSAVPSLCPSSPSASSDSNDHFFPPDAAYPDTLPMPLPLPLPLPSARHTRLFESDLIATLEYDYAAAVSQLARAPSPLPLPSPGPGPAVVVPPAGCFADARPGTSADTVTGRACMFALQRAGSGASQWSTADSADSADLADSELPVSPGWSASEFSSSSGGRSRASSSSASSADGCEYVEDEEGEGEGKGEGKEEDGRCVFGIPWPSVGADPARTPPSSFYMDELSDAECPVDDGARSSLHSGDSDSAEEPMDGGEEGSRRSAANGRSSAASGYGAGYNGRSNGAYHGNGNGNGYGASAGGYGGHGGLGGGRRGRDDDDDDRKRRPTLRPNALSSTDSDTSEDDEDSTDSGEDAPAPRHPTPPRRVRSPGAAEDDVPLAQQIPTALKAQRTIRRQVRDEIDQRRHERTLRGQATNDRRDALARSAKAAEPTGVRTLSGTAARSPQEAAASPPRQAARPRTKTLPGNVSSPLSVVDLTKKLLGLQANGALPASISRKRPSVDLDARAVGSSTRAPSRDVSLTRGRAPSDADRSAALLRHPSRAARDVPEPDGGRGRTLRPQRSFHHPSPAPADPRAPPLPASAGGLSRAGTTASKREPASVHPVPGVMPSPRLSEQAHPGMERSRSVKPPSRRPSADRDRPRMPSAEPESISAALRSRVRKPSVSATEAAPAVPHAVVSPFAPLPAAAFLQSAVSHQPKGQSMWQQRIFIGTMQRFVTVEIGSSTSAADVLQTVDGQGKLGQAAGSGGWMLWELSQDFGMERPIRSFELLSDVCGSWNSDKIVNLLVIKKTLLAPLLSRSNIPASSPTCGGYVQYEYKRGKWQKRWMELREHSLWLSKRNTQGKDQTFLCSLNNFDAYYVTRPHKAPKPYVFAVKSTDSLAFFENTADYVHVFSAGEGEGKNWLEKILLARSYVLYQERNVLSSSAGPNLTRAGTRVQPPGQRPAQPLVNVGPPKPDMPSTVAIGFEPGSLLAKR